MAIVNGYCTLVEYKAYHSPEGISSVSAGDDTVIEDIIEAVSRYIDNHTGRQFYQSAAETRYFDIPSGRTLFVDKDLISVTTLTNGNGVAIVAADYQLLPLNIAPKYAVRLKQASGVTWECDGDGNTEGVISITGNWGYASAPDDIKQACLSIVGNLYRGRTGANAEGSAQVTGAGVVITPKDVPPLARDILNSYKRVM